VNEIKTQNPKKDLAQLVSNLKVDSLSSRLIGIPQRLHVKLRYVDAYTHTHTSGAVQTWQLRGNSVFDPDYTYTGHTPNGFSELAVFYSWYLVRSSRIKVTFTGLTASVPVVCAIKPTAELANPTSYVDFVEATLATMKVMGSIDVPQENIVQSASTSRMFDAQLSKDQDFGALVTTNPAKVWYWNICTQSANKASTTSIAMVVEVEYEVEFDQKQVL
jgi:hypothetical protein